MDKSIYYYSNKFHSDFNHNPNPGVKCRSLIMNILNAMFLMIAFYNIVAIGLLTDTEGLSVWFWMVAAIELYVMAAWSYSDKVRRKCIFDKLKLEYGNAISKIFGDVDIKLIHIKRAWFRSELKIPESEYLKIAEFSRHAEGMNIDSRDRDSQIYKKIFSYIYSSDSKPRITTYFVWAFSAIVLILIRDDAVTIEDIFLLVSETQWDILVGIVGVMFFMAVSALMSIGQLHSLLNPYMHPLFVIKTDGEKHDLIKLRIFVDQLMIHAKAVGGSQTLSEKFSWVLYDAGRNSDKNRKGRGF